MDTYIDLLKFFVAEFEWDAKNLKGANGFKPLHYAVRHDHLSIVKYFVEELKCDPDSITKFGVTPLCCSAFHGHLDITKYLLEHKACLNTHLSMLQHPKITSKLQSVFWLPFPNLLSLLIILA